MAGRQQWGWHRLDDRWAERLVADAAIPRGATVLDVGAGHGAITAPLLAAGAHVIAVEAHRGRAARLRARFGDALTVVEADGSDLWLPRRPFHVVANPPFAISAALVRRLLQPGSRLVTARLVLQEQAVRRWTGDAAPGAGRWARHFAVGAGVPVPRSAFTPRPRVDTRVLVIERRGRREPGGPRPTSDRRGRLTSRTGRARGERR